MIQQKFRASSTNSTEDDISKGFYLYFLNTGVLDNLIVEADFTPATRSTSDVGMAFVSINSETINNLFREWLKSQPIADFLDVSKNISSIYSCKYVTGERIKLINDKFNTKLPKDLTKSFLTRASNLLQKFAVDYGKSHPNHKQINGKPATVEDWLRRALEMDDYVRWDSLRKIRILYKKYSIKEPLDEVVAELLKLAQIHEVMNA